MALNQTQIFFGTSKIIQSFTQDCTCIIYGLKFESSYNTANLNGCNFSASRADYDLLIDKIIYDMHFDNRLAFPQLPFYRFSTKPQRKIAWKGDFQNSEKL